MSDRFYLATHTVEGILRPQPWLLRLEADEMKKLNPKICGCPVYVCTDPFRVWPTPTDEFKVFKCEEIHIIKEP